MGSEPYSSYKISSSGLRYYVSVWLVVDSEKYTVQGKEMWYGHIEDCSLTEYSYCFLPKNGAFLEYISRKLDPY